MEAPFIRMGMHKQAEAEALEKAKQGGHGTVAAT